MVTRGANLLVPLVNGLQAQKYQAGRSQTFSRKAGFHTVKCLWTPLGLLQKIGNQEFMPQVIDNNKQLYEPNINEMIRKSGIPKAEWADFRQYLKSQNDKWQMKK